MTLAVLCALLVATGVPSAHAAGDPAPSLTRGRDRVRTLECERMGAQLGNERYPGLIPAVRPRGEYVERDVLVCLQRILRAGLRSDRDEAVLSTLRPLVSDLTAAASQLHPELAGRTWLVETYYPSSQVSAKLSFAMKNALGDQGLRVSDRTPVLTAGDVDVLTRMAPEEAYPAACQRYGDNGSLGPGDALLAVVSRDSRETILHAGLCADGRWAWLK